MEHEEAKKVDDATRPQTNLRSSFKTAVTGILDNAEALLKKQQAEQQEAIGHLRSNLDQLFDSVVANTDAGQHGNKH